MSEALEPSFLSIINEAIEARWSRQPVIGSLGDLVDNLWFEDQAFPDGQHTEEDRATGGGIVWLNAPSLPG
jgi:hypothetical protein